MNESKSTTKKITGIRVRLIIVVALYMLATYLILGYMHSVQLRSTTKEQINERMLDVVNTAAAMVDGDIMQNLTADDVGTPEYQQIYDTLARFRDNTNLEYIYYGRDMGDKTFTFGIDTDPVAPAEFGDPMVYTDALYKASQGTPSVDDEPYEDQWGRFYSAFSPVYDSSGKLAGIVTADFNAVWYEEQMNRSQRAINTACVVFMVIGIILTLVLAKYYGSQVAQLVRSECQAAFVEAETGSDAGNDAESKGGNDAINDAED